MSKQFTLSQGDVIPMLVAVPSQDIRAGMTIWGEVDSYERLILTPYGSPVQSDAHTGAMHGIFWIEVDSPEEGNVLLSYGRDVLVLVVATGGLPDSGRRQ